MVVRCTRAPPNGRVVAAATTSRVFKPPLGCDTAVLTAMYAHQRGAALTSPPPTVWRFPGSRTYVKVDMADHPDVSLAWMPASDPIGFNLKPRPVGGSVVFMVRAALFPFVVFRELVSCL